jgi:hypothetical protein
MRAISSVDLFGLAAALVGSMHITDSWWAWIMMSTGMSILFGGAIGEAIGEIRAGKERP